MMQCIYLLVYCCSQVCYNNLCLELGMFLVLDDVLDDSEEHLEDGDDNHHVENDNYSEVDDRCFVDSSQTMSFVGLLAQMTTQQRMVQLATLATQVVKEKNLKTQLECFQMNFFILILTTDDFGYSNNNLN